MNYLIVALVSYAIGSLITFILLTRSKKIFDGSLVSVKKELKELREKKKKAESHILEAKEKLKKLKAKAELIKNEEIDYNIDDMLDELDDID